MMRIPRVSTAALPALLLLPLACSFGEPAGEEDLPDVFGMFPLSSTSADVQTEVVHTMHAFDMSRVYDAREHAQNVIELDPMYAFGYLIAAWAGNSFDEYRSNLRRAIENAATANDVERALIEAEQKAFDADPEGALAIEQELAASDPQNPLFQLILAQRYAGMNRTEEARAAARSAVELAPEYAGAIIWLGINYTTQQPTDFAEAERLLQRAVQLDAEEAWTYDYLGDVHRMQGRLDEALAGYTRAIELDSTEQGFIGQRGHVYSFMNNYAAARADYDAAARQAARNARDGDAAWWTRQVAYTHLYEGNLDASLEKLAEAVAITDTLSTRDALEQRIGANFDVMLIAGDNGRLDVARAAYDRFEDLLHQQAEETANPEFTTGVENRLLIQAGFLALRSGDIAGTRARAQESMDLMADMRSPRRFEGAHALLAFADLAEGRFAQAVGHFEQTDPNNVYQTYYHARALEGAGRMDEAMELYRRVAEYRFSNIGTVLVKPAAQRRVAEAAAAG